jgi:hypothetical protein
MVDRALPTSRSRWLLAAVAALVAAAALVLAAGLGSGSQPAGAKHTDGHQPANKVAVSGSDVKEAKTDETLTLLSTDMRNAEAKALTLDVTLECSILTDLTTRGNDESEAEATLEVWVEVDGRRVGVSEADENGTVTFCNRTYRRETRLFDDEDATIDDHIDTKQAHGFNWIDLDAGKGVHTIAVKGRLETSSTDNADATVTVGNRTLIVEPVDTAHDETLAN